jgi:type VI secretion system protein ImpH
MAGPGGTPTHPLIDALHERPFEFSFFAAVRRLESVRRDLPRVGTSPRALDDPVRFGQEPSLGFAPATLHAFETREGRTPRMLVNFMGLLGPNGPMPLFLTEYARDRIINAHDHTLAHFLDLFNHRMVALLYRAWASSRHAASFDRPETDRFGAYIGSLFGLGMESLRGRDALSDTAKFYYSGYYAAQTRHAAGLRAMLEDYLGVPTTVEEFVGRWMDLPPDSRCRLGVSRDAGALGRTAVVGSRMWDCQQQFRVHLGPVSFTQYERLLPGRGGASLARVAAMIRNYIGDELEWDLRLVLKAGEVPAVRLGAVGRLGWSTWLKSRPFTHDAGDLILRPRLN